MSESTMKMKNQPSQSHWWWLDDNTTVRRSAWLQSTLTGILSTSFPSFYSFEFLFKIFLISVRP